MNNTLRELLRKSIEKTTRELSSARASVSRLEGEIEKMESVISGGGKNHLIEIGLDTEFDIRTHDFVDYQVLTRNCDSRGLGEFLVELNKNLDLISIKDYHGNLFDAESCEEELSEADDVDEVKNNIFDCLVMGEMEHYDPKDKTVKSGCLITCKSEDIEKLMEILTDYELSSDYSIDVRLI